MSAFPVRRLTVPAVRTGLMFAVAAAIALSAGGCANTNTTYSANPSYVAQAPAVQMESDGLPVQAAPSALIRQLPDDPGQPFSPNYGGSNPARATSPPTVRASKDAVPEKAAMSATIPADLPPAFRRQLVATLDASG